MGNVNIEVPDELHKKFKIISIEREIDMKDLLVNLIADCVKKNDKNKKT
jgi:hypothetical protein